MNSKLLSKSILIFGFSILMNIYVFGQSYHVVVILNDNSTVKGELLELTTDSVAVIEEETGKFILLKGSEISTVYIKGLNESINFPISEVPDIFKKAKKEKTAVPYTPGAVYTPGESYTPVVPPTQFTIGAAFGGVIGASKEAVDGFKSTEFIGNSVFGGSFLVIYSRGFGIGLSIQSISMDLEEDGVNFGTLNLIPVMLLLQWQRIPYAAGFGTHFNVGVGINLSSFDNGDFITELERQFGTNVNVETEIAFTLDFGGGFDYFFSEQFSIFIEGRFMLGSISTSWLVSNSVPIDGFDSFSVTNFQYLAGLRAWFN